MGKYRIVNISMPEELFALGEEAAKDESRTRSEFYREALRFYLEERHWRKLQRESAGRATHPGIENEEEVAKLVAEERDHYHWRACVWFWIRVFSFPHRSSLRAIPTMRCAW
jgi:metal-responsive CopG/Arc/MetJ family transcriptional regulator